MNKKWIPIVAVLLLLVIGWYWRQTPETRVSEKTELAMDTIVQMKVMHQDHSANAALTVAFTKIAYLDSLCATTSPSSQISVLNSLSGSGTITAAPELVKILNAARYVSELSLGAFDISVWPILRLWNFSNSSEAYRLPQVQEITTQLPLVDYRQVFVDSPLVRLGKNGMAIDVGGIAKGLAIDLACDVLAEMGYTDYIVDAGGDLRVHTGPLSEQPPKIWIKHPRHPDTLWGYLTLSAGSVATSGDYERFFWGPDSTRYHHILDPKTGYPAIGCVSVTIVSETALLADALATAVFVMGPQKGLDLVNSLPGIEALILFEKNNRLDYVISPGLSDKLTLSEIKIVDMK